MKKWSYTFLLCDTEEIARTMCARHMRGVSDYVRRRYPAKVTPWSSPDGSEKGYVAWVPSYSTR